MEMKRLFQVRWLFGLVLIAIGFFSSCVEDEQPPLGSDFEVSLSNTDYYFYRGSEVTLIGTGFSQNDEVYVTGNSISVLENIFGGHYVGDYTDLDVYGITDDMLDTRKADIKQCNANELSFIIPEELAVDQKVLVSVKKDGIYHKIGTLFLDDFYFEAYYNSELGKSVILIHSDHASLNDKVYLQYVVVDGENEKLIGERYEVSVLDANEGILTVEGVGLGNMKLTYIREGRTFEHEAIVTLNPQSCVQLLNGNKYAENAEVTLVGSSFTENDMVFLVENGYNTRSVEITSVENNLLKFQLPPEVKSGSQQSIYLYRYGLEFCLGTIYIN